MKLIKVRSYGDGLYSRALAVIKPGHSFASAAVNAVQIWLYDKESPITTQKLPTTPTALAVSANGQVLAAGCSDGSIRIFSIDNLELKSIGIIKTDSYIMSVALDHSGVRLYFGNTESGGVQIYSTKDGKKMGEFAGHKKDSVHYLSLASSPTNLFVLTGNRARFIDILSGRIIWEYKQKSALCAASWAKVGNGLALGDVDGGVSFFKSGKRVWYRSGRKPTYDHPVDEVHAIDISPSLDRIAVSSTDGVFCLDSKDGHVVSQTTDVGEDVVFPKDGSSIIISGRELSEFKIDFSNYDF